MAYADYKDFRRTAADKVVFSMLNINTFTMDAILKIKIN